MDRFRTPLRYPGGKRALYKLLAELLSHNGILDGYYVEPFAGGSGLALELLFREYVDRIYLNDADLHIYAFWRSILDESQTLIEKIRTVEVTINEWKKQKSIYDDADKHPLIDVAFSTFFLNRCNRSGILGGRPIGGLNQTGPWKIDARFNRGNLIARIEMIALYKDRIQVSGVDAQDFLRDSLKDLDEAKTLVYLDPPYYVMGGELYLNNYAHEDHVSLAQYITHLPFKWVLSYDDVPEIRELYKDRKSFNVGFYYRANARKEGKEVMFLSNNLLVPPEWQSPDLQTRPAS